MGFLDWVYPHGGHPSGWQKYLMGWIPYHNAPSDGTYTLKALEGMGSGDKFARIHFATDQVCLEYRKPLAASIDYDVFHLLTDLHLTATEQQSANQQSMMTDGCVFVSLCTYRTGPPRERDLSSSMPTESILQPNGSSNLRDRIDACVRAGEQFTQFRSRRFILFTPGPNDTAAITLDIDETKL